MVNAVEIAFDKAEATVMMQQLAAGDLSEDEVARWFRDHIVEPG
jgi:death-on-curing protein